MTYNNKFVCTGLKSASNSLSHYLKHRMIQVEHWDPLCYIFIELPCNNEQGKSKVGGRYSISGEEGMAVVCDNLSWFIQLQNYNNKCEMKEGYLLGTFSRKNCFSFGFCLNEGGGPCQIFVTFSKVHFCSITAVYFLQNANNLNFKLFI